MSASVIGENGTLNEIVQPNPNFATIYAATATDAELYALMQDEACRVKCIAQSHVS